MVFDNSSPIENVVNVYKTEHHKGKWFDSYQLTLGIDAENKFRIPVEEDVYFNSLNEKKLTIIQHQGLLNQSWISEYKYNK